MYSYTIFMAVPAETIRNCDVFPASFLAPVAAENSTHCAKPAVLLQDFRARVLSSRMENPPLDIVRTLLANHTPADASETDSLRRINELVATATAPFSRAHYIPGHLTASAIVLDESREHALLIFHAKLHLWLHQAAISRSANATPASPPHAKSSKRPASPRAGQVHRPCCMTWTSTRFLREKQSRSISISTCACCCSVRGCR